MVLKTQVSIGLPPGVNYHIPYHVLVCHPASGIKISILTNCNYVNYLQNSKKNNQNVT